MLKFKSVFTRRTLLCLMLCYDKRGLRPRISYGYIASVADDYWGVGLNMLEDIIYPLGVNMHEAIALLEMEGPEALAELEVSECFVPVVHERKLLLRVIQALMAERTGSGCCRAMMGRRIGTGIDRVGVDFRSKAKTITMHKVEEYSAAAGITLSDAFRRYFELYSGDEEKVNYKAYPVL